MFQIVRETMLDLFYPGYSTHVSQGMYGNNATCGFGKDSVSFTSPLLRYIFLSIALPIFLVGVLVAGKEEGS